MNTAPPTHTRLIDSLTSLIMGLMSSRPVRVCVCVCTAGLGRPPHTPSQGGSLIYKASNEVQQNRGVRTTRWMIVCLFTFLLFFVFLTTSTTLHPHPPMSRRCWTRLENHQFQQNNIYNIIYTIYIIPTKQYIYINIYIDISIYLYIYIYIDT